MKAEGLLREISLHCREARLAESTFGRRAVNDGKLVSRLRTGGTVTAATLDRIKSFLLSHETKGRSVIVNRVTRSAAKASKPGATTMQSSKAAVAGGGDEPRHFRFFDNRQKYLLFVNTCSEKWVVANRVSLELANIHPRPPAVRIFDAGVGDGTVLTRVMRSMHRRFPAMPFYVAGKEASLEDVRLTLEKMPDRFFEHPSTVLVLTNLYYSEAPWLTTKSVSAASSLVWHEVALTGDSSASFDEQITELQPFLAENWKSKTSPKTGNPIYERPVVLVVYRDDHKFLLNPVIPRRGRGEAGYDLVIASQPYRARASLEFKVGRVLAPLARALGRGGRMIGIHSSGNDPGLEIIHKVWPNDNPFIHNRYDLLKAVKKELGSDGRDLNFNTLADNRSFFRYGMHTLPSEVSESIGTSTVFAAWNAAIYVAQVEDQRLEEVVKDGSYLEGSREVLQRHGGLWFNDESFVISHKRD